jgi:hypothetical protein
MMTTDQVRTKGPDYSFQTLFDALGVIAVPMHQASNTELSLLNRIFERVRCRMADALYREVNAAPVRD